jgi:ribosomal protein L20
VALPLLALLQGLDKASIILNRRPLMRMAIITYMVLVHAAVVLV